MDDELEKEVRGFVERFVEGTPGPLGPEQRAKMVDTYVEKRVARD